MVPPFASPPRPEIPMPERILEFLRPVVLIAGIIAAGAAWGARLEYVAATHATTGDIDQLRSHVTAEDRILDEQLRQLNAKMDMVVRYICRQRPDDVGC